METQLKYLETKIAKSKAHIACNLLKDVSSVNLKSYLVFTMDTIQQHFTRNSTRGNKSYQGEANLTHLSIAVGSFILDDIKYSNKDHAPWDWFRLRAMMGDLFIEAFYQTHQINIGKTKDNKFVPVEELDRSLKRSRAHYIVVPELWNLIIPDSRRDLLRGTAFEKPEDINNLIQTETLKPVIKGWDYTRRREFNKHLNSNFIKSMNVLQQTAWKINPKVRNALMKNRHKLLDQYKPFVKKYKSKVIEFDLTMARANAIGEDVFYQYVEADYRGRIYYTTPFLNFQGNDLARGQMLFATGKPMNEEGLRRLKIHIATSYNETYNKNKLPNWLTTDYKPFLDSEGLDDISVDKMTLEDREAWTDNNIHFILDLAKTETIDAKAEKPVSLLAAALEIYDSLNEDEYISYLPIPVDGSNNGWQHLSAMSKDKQAGELVGVVPQEIQKDFYVQCAKSLIKKAPEWFEERQMPMKHIRKGITKRGSMTRAYSAGALKIAENMYLDCHVEGYLDKYNITEDDCLMLSRKLVKAIDEVCAGPLQTMKFLQKIAESEIASDYAKDRKLKSIRWTTPSGFPVIYESFTENEFKEKATISCSEREVKPTILKEDGSKEETDTIRIQHVGKEPTDKPKIRSFMSGISPNFVHSMDAAHMANVICEWEGDFGAVHDSFSVHACDIDKLLNLIKDKFIKMYSYPNFFDVIEKMIVTNPDFNYRQPTIGELNIKEVQNSDYFFA